jgi:CubicO group peptidase (beta-lactamase class C family)
MSISRRKLLQNSLLCAAGTIFGSVPSLAQDFIPTPNTRRRVAQLATDFLDAHHVPGLSISIAIGGKPAYAKAFGVADRQTGEPLRPQHLFRIASISKPITSAGIHTLIEAGKLRLDSRVFGPDSIFGDDYPLTPRPGHSALNRSIVEKITIEHLLTHTTGGWRNDWSDPMLSNREMNHHDLIVWTLGNVPLNLEPGQSFAYSNFGYCLLGRMIEKLSGQTYEQYIKDNVLARCGISDMHIGGNTLEARASGEVKYYDQAAYPYGMNVTRNDSGGGWIGTASDLTTFFTRISGFQNTAQLFGDETLKSMTTPSSANPRYGKGLSVDGRNNWWHGGSMPGTETIAVRTGTNVCASAFINARTRFPGALDQLLWHMAHSVVS